MCIHCNFITFAEFTNEEQSQQPVGQQRKQKRNQVTSAKGDDLMYLAICYVYSDGLYIKFANVLSAKKVHT